MLFRDILNRASKAAIEEKASDIPEGLKPAIQASQNALIDTFSQMFANDKINQKENASKNESDTKTQTENSTKNLKTETVRTKNVEKNFTIKLSPPNGNIFGIENSTKTN